MSGDVMPWDVGGESDRRAEFVAALSAPGVNVSELCRRFGVSRKTGYKWKQRHEVEGLAGLADRSKKPRSSPTRTDPVVEEMVCGVRRDHPVWGARKIRAVLIRRGVAGLPAVSTITEILRRNGLLTGPGMGTVTWTRFEAESPNDLWQMDFKGWFFTGDGRCEPFDVMDDHSRFNLCLDAHANQQETTIRTRLEAVFTTYGLPDRILCDNGSPWANTQDGFRWTGLGVWLLDLGVGLSHSRIAHPQTIGKDERFHRTLKLEVLSTRSRWDSHDQVQAAFDAWRPVYNHERPHDALGGGVPSDRYQPSPRQLPIRIEPFEYSAEFEVRSVSEKAQIGFRSRRVRIGMAFAGRRVGLKPADIDGRFDVYYRSQYIRTIDLTE